MAKQEGLYRIKGKFEGKSYFHPKYAPAPVFRRISDAISENVLHSPAYERLRLNSYEFGGCSAYAAQMIKFGAILSGQFFLRNFHAVFTRKLVDIMRKDASHVVGKRQFVGYDWQTNVLQWLSLQQKNDPAKYFGLVDFTADGAGMSDPSKSMLIKMQAPNGWDEKLLAAGANEIEISTQVCGAILTPPTVQQKYSVLGQTSNSRHVETITLNSQPLLWQFRHYMSNYYAHNVSNQCSFAVIAFRPKKRVGRDFHYIPSLDTLVVIRFDYN